MKCSISILVVCICFLCSSCDKAQLRKEDSRKPLGSALEKDCGTPPSTMTLSVMVNFRTRLCDSPSDTALYTDSSAFCYYDTISVWCGNCMTGFHLYPNDTFYFGFDRLPLCSAADPSVNPTPSNATNVLYAKNGVGNYWLSNAPEEVNIDEQYCGITRMYYTGSFSY